MISTFAPPSKEIRRLSCLRNIPSRLSGLHSVLAAAVLPLLFTVFAAPVRPQQSASADPSDPAHLLHDSVTRQGPLSLGDQRYTVQFLYKVLQERPSSAAASATPPSTLARFDIVASPGGSLYHQEFPYDVSQGRFQRHLTASASLLSGNGGTALVIRFLDQPNREGGNSGKTATESWQLFSVVNGQLHPFGPLLPLGHGSDITVGGTLAAVMTKGGIAVMPIASTAEVLALRVWTGNFYASVPVRFDWPHGQWGEGQQCYRNSEGTLAETGCILPVQANPRPLPADADFPFVQLFPAPDGNASNSTNVLITPNKPVEFLEMQAITRWHPEGPQGQRVSCSFSEVWLRVRIDGNEGWVHGQDALAALGLPLSSPPTASQ
jgi:hypothetical protein